MALVACHECGQSISEQAPACPHCGIPRHSSGALVASAPAQSGQGSAGNVIAALASFFFPGLGQLVQGRVGAGIGFFLLSCVLWLFLMGWVIHIVAAIEAAAYKPGVVHRTGRLT